MNLDTIKTPAELLAIDDQEPKYSFAEFIKQGTFSERRLAKKKLKLLKAIDPAVRAITDDDEQVFYVTSGLRVSSFEQLFIGWISYYYNLMAFVFTTKRVLLIHLKGNKRGTYLGSLEYVDIRQVKASFTGNFFLKLLNGKTVLFTRIPKADRVFVRDFVNALLDPAARKDKRAPGIRHLCPSCFSELLRVPAACPECRSAFKQPRKAALLSLLLPGLGDLYSGHKFLGAMEMMVMLFVWTGFIAEAVESLRAGESMAYALTPLLVLFIFVHPLDAIKAHYLTNKGLLPLTPVRFPGE